MKMKVRIKLVLKIVLALVIIFAFGFLFYKLYSLRIDIFDFVVYQKAKRLQVRLLCKTDHQVLLDACRKISRQVAAGDLNPGDYNIRYGPRLPEVSRFPKPILDLGPRDVFIDKDGRVILEMLVGRVGHFGVKAYTEGYKKPIINFKYGDKKLIDGLWYYDDGYVGNPEYDKKIEALIRRGKQIYGN